MTGGEAAILQQLAVRFRRQVDEDTRIFEERLEGLLGDPARVEELARLFAEARERYQETAGDLEEAVEVQRSEFESLQREAARLRGLEAALGESLRRKDRTIEELIVSGHLRTAEFEQKLASLKAEPEGALRKRLAEAERLNEILQTNIRIASEARRRAESDRDELKAELRSLQGSGSRAADLENTHRARQAAATETHKQLEARIAAQRQEIEALRAKLDRERAEGPKGAPVEALEADRRAAEEEAALAELAAARDRLDTQAALLRIGVERETGLRAEAARLETERAARGKELDEARQEARGLAAQIESLEEARRRLEEGEERARERIESLLKEQARLEADLRTRSDMLGELQGRVDHERKLGELKDVRIAELERELEERRRNSVKDTQRIIRKIESQLETPRAKNPWPEFPKTPPPAPRPDPNSAEIRAIASREGPHTRMPGAELRLYCGGLLKRRQIGRSLLGLGEAGLRACVSQPLRPGERVRVTVRLDKFGESIDADAQVNWCQEVEFQKAYDLDLTFTRLRDDARRTIRLWAARFDPGSPKG